MRNWNVPKTNCQWKSCIVESLPMRNWNYILLLACVKHLRWEPTYEELKLYSMTMLFTPDGVESLPMRNWNAMALGIFTFFDPIGLRAYLWGIETFKLSVFRNWTFKLRAYLWGIETWFSISFSSFSSRLRAYLWGIETKTSQIFSHPSTTGWEPTYEELKHILQATAVVPLPRVESLPMRNWNGSALLLDEGVFRIVESLPMRNWNMNFLLQAKL